MGKKTRSNQDECNQMAMEIMRVVARLAEESDGECECTVHRRSGDIIDVCPSCHAYTYLSEIHSTVMGFSETGVKQ